ncbi:CsbD family protein [Phycicoccus flavus]|uniref:CsbD family protein n=1 Tax=Phycicoccus flavus TaxID=2502783 RepID=UPI000FEB8C57|nr:CsbD family protein [Phycicoccus flavus]NHA69217.1 CsbD family protein [Phycicoccus flavus]
MGFDDKMSNHGQDAEGKVKEAVGKSTDDESMEAEGKADQSSADLKNAGEKIKDAFKH